MAQQFYNLNLRDAIFTMLSEQQTRTIMGSDVGKAPAEEDRPGLSYCHNVMPSKQGFDSISYLSVISPFFTYSTTLMFKDARVVYGDNKSRLYLAWDSIGNVYALLGGATTWIELPVIKATISSPFSSDSITIGTVNGVSYIFYAGLGAYTYDEVSNVLRSVILDGLNIEDTVGITSSSGYLIAYTTLAIAWSSTIDPTDFVPSAVTGAGGGNVAGTSGAILFILANPLGVLVYTKANTLAGTYTGNSQFPFKFRPVDEGKGGLSLDLVAYEDDAKKQYIYSKAGLQAVTSQRAEIILPEVTDFLAGKRFEDYNEVTKEYEITDLTLSQTMLKKVKYVASRYLIISYGVTSFTHAIVVDIALGKLGKLKIDHVDAFEYIDSQVEISKESIAFLLADGEVKVVDVSVTTASSGVLILGKYQASRTRFLTLLGIELENIASDAELTVSSQVSLNGKTFTSVEGSLKASDTNYREYVFRATGKNHSIALTGQFNLVTAQIRYTISGKR